MSRSWIPRSPAECIGLTVGQFRAYAAGDLDWSNQWPVIARRSLRHRWRIVEIVDSSAIDARGLTGVALVHDHAKPVEGHADWFVTPETLTPYAPR